MASLWTLSGVTPTAFAARIWHQIWEDRIFAHAAQLSYYFLFALFPLLLLLVTVLGFFADSGSELRANMLLYLGQLMPASASDLVRATVDEISSSATSSKFSFGLLASLWAASNGMAALSDSLNVAFGIRETRAWWHARLTHILLTVILTVLLLAALTLMLRGSHIAETIATSHGLGTQFTYVWKVAQWPIAMLNVLAAINLIYHFAPAPNGRPWRWLTPGAVIALGSWLLVSYGFRLYLSYFNGYGATYGSLGAVIVLLLWLYFTGAAIIVGCEINSELEKAAALPALDEVSGAAQASIPGHEPESKQGQ